MKRKQYFKICFSFTLKRYGEIFFLLEVFYLLKYTVSTNIINK